MDIDDVLSRTVESLIELLERLHARRVDLEEVRHFDLGRSFELQSHEIDSLMDHAHSDAAIESIRPAEGASEVLDLWSEAGDRVSLVTGRPPTTHEASRRWLETHGLRHDSLHHLDKWNRPGWNREGLPALRYAEIGEFGFEFAVEDSLETAVRLIDEFEVPVALMDRPWNREIAMLPRKTRSRLVRCFGWQDVRKAFP